MPLGAFQRLPAPADSLDRPASSNESGGAVFSKLIYLVLLAAIAFGCCYAAFLIQRHQDTLPIEYETFGKFYPAAIKKQAIWLGVAGLAELLGGLGFGFIVLLFAVAPWVAFKPGPKEKFDIRKLEAKAKANNEKWLTDLGPNWTERAKSIQALFEQKTATINASECQRWTDKVRDAAIADINYYVYFEAMRNLAAMSFQERVALEFAEHMNSLANGPGGLLPPEPLYGRWRTSLVWGDGKGQLGPDGVEFKGLNPGNPIADYLTRMGLTVQAVINQITIHAGQIQSDQRQPKEVREMCQSMLERFVSSAA
jgi:hypothetical protein